MFVRTAFIRCSLKERLCRLYERKFFLVKFCCNSEGFDFLHLEISILSSCFCIFLYILLCKNNEIQLVLFILNRVKRTL